MIRIPCILCGRPVCEFTPLQFTDKQAFVIQKLVGAMTMGTGTGDVIGLLVNPDPDALAMTFKIQHTECGQ